MKWTAIILLSLVSSAFAATPITVSGTIQTGAGVGLKGNAFVRFRLRNYSGFVPRTDTVIIVNTQFDVRPTNTAGDFSTTLYSNDDIIPNTCGVSGTDPCTWWTIEYWNDGKAWSSGNYCIPNTSPTYDLNGAVPCQTPPLPPGPAPIGGGSGTVVSVGMTGDNVIYQSTVTGSPVTTSGTLIPVLKTQSANTVLAGPGSGSAATPTFRTLIPADVTGTAFGTASVTAPTGAATSTCVGNPFSWIQDAGGTFQTQASVDTSFVVTGFSSNGFMNFCRPPVFNSTGATPGFIANGSSFNVWDQFSASPDRHMSSQWQYQNAVGDSSTYTTGNLNQLYAEMHIRGTPTINTTFVSAFRIRFDDDKVGGSKPRVWGPFQAAVDKTQLYDITNCAGGINGLSNGPCYAGYYGEIGANLPGSENEAGAVYDVFAGGTHDAATKTTGATGNVFHALIQASTANQFTNTNGFTSEDFGTKATNYDLLLKGVNASGTPSGFNAAVGPFSFGSTTHPGAGIQIDVTGGSTRSPSFATSSVCSANGTAANPSVVSCGSAAAGRVSCSATASGGTCTINTTAITATSQIFIEPNTAEGTALSVTCNTSPSAVPVDMVASKVANTSVTLNMPTITTNPQCYYYWIVN